MTGETTPPLAGCAGARLVSFDELTGEEIDAWHALRASNPALDSPYFHPGFAAAVHASGRPVSVVVVRDDAAGAVSALLPGHREGARAATRGLARRRLSGTGARAWHGTVAHRPPGGRCARIGVRPPAPPGPGFDPWIISSQPSPYLDTTGGLDGYLARASRSGKDNMRQARRRAAKAERTQGPIRFAADVVDDAALARVIELKRAQYAATGARDYFAHQTGSS